MLLLVSAEGTSAVEVTQEGHGSFEVKDLTFSQGWLSACAVIAKASPTDWNTKQGQVGVGGTWTLRLINTMDQSWF